MDFPEKLFVTREEVDTEDEFLGLNVTINDAAPATSEPAKEVAVYVLESKVMVKTETRVKVTSKKG